MLVPAGVHCLAIIGLCHLALRLSKACRVVFVSDFASLTGVDRFFLTLLPPKKSLDDPNSMEAQLTFKPADEQIVPLRQVSTETDVVQQEPVIRQPTPAGYQQLPVIQQ